MTEWQDVPQDSPPPSRTRPVAVKLSLAIIGRAATPGGRSSLNVALPAPICAALGWAIGDRLGVSLGVSARTAGWLRIAPAPSGRVLRKIGLRETLVVSLVAPPAWQHLLAPRTPAEHRQQGDALLVRIPWDMDDLAAEPAEEVA